MLIMITNKLANRIPTQKPLTNKIKTVGSVI